MTTISLSLVLVEAVLYHQFNRCEFALCNICFFAVDLVLLFFGGCLVGDKRFWGLVKSNTDVEAPDRLLFSPVPCLHIVFSAYF